MLIRVCCVCNKELEVVDSRDPKNVRYTHTYCKQHLESTLALWYAMGIDIAELKNIPWPAQKE